MPTREPYQEPPSPLQTGAPMRPDGDHAQIVLDLLGQLAKEINPGRTEPQLDLDSSIELDVGLDSLARMELLRRLERCFQTRLPEQDVLAADSVRDVLATLERVTAVTQVPRPARPAAAAILRRGTPERAATLVDALEWHVEAQPEFEHIRLLAGADDSVATIRYRDLWLSAGRVAGGLRERALEPGQSVALMLPTGAEFFYAFVGILLAGGVPVPIYPPLRMAQIEEHLRRQATILDNAQAIMLITVTEARGVGRFLKTRLPRLREVMTTEELLSARPGPRVKLNGDDVALVQYTSGSTGNPKGVVLTHANLLANIRAMGAALQVSSSDVFVSWLPLYHDMGLIGAWMGTLYYGFPLILMSPLTFIARPQRWLWAIHRFRGTLSAGPNFAYELCWRKIDERDIEGLDLSSLRFACNGAEPVSADTIAQFSKRFRHYGFHPEAMAPVYGLAECSVGLAFPPPSRGPRVDSIDQAAFRTRSTAVAVAPESPGALRIVGCGMPLPEHEVRIIDSTGHELGDRHVGKLQFRGPSATRGYFRNPQATKMLVQDDWLDSGDYAYLVDGEIFIAGREKDLIIRAGRNIYPYELEHAVGELEGIRAGGVAVFGSIDLTRGAERMIVLAETRERRPQERARLKREIERLALDLVQMPPDDVVLAPPRSVLKTSSGKIRRSACRELYDKGRIGQRRSVWSQFAHLAVAALGPLIRRGWSNLEAQLYALYAWSLFAALTVPVWLLVMLLPGRSLPHTVIRGAVRLLAWGTGSSFRVRGREHIPRDGSCIVAANHASYLDALVLSAALPHGFRFVAKRELLGRNWFLRILLNKAGTWFVERFDPGKGIEDMAHILDAAARGQSLVFFPEGTFTRAPGLRVFRMGAFVSAAHANLPILPVAIRGTRAILRGARWFPRRGSIDITFLAPVTPAGNDWEAAIALRDTVRVALLKACSEPDLTPS